MEILRDNWKLAAGLTAAAATGAVAGALIRDIKTKQIAKLESIPKKWIRVGAVNELIIYPVKSCQGVSLSEATCTNIGLKGSKYLRDRIFMVVDDRFVFQSQRQIPKMALIQVLINDNRVTLRSPGFDNLVFIPPQDKPELRRSCRIFQEPVKVALDCGDEVATWLSKVLEKEGLRLLFHSFENTQREMNGLQKKFPAFAPEDKGAFSDQTSYMLMSEESVNMLNTKLENPVTHKNFRPSILLNGVLDPFSEDYWGYVRIGDFGPVFKASKPCTRCILTTVDPEKGTFSENKEPLNTLTKFVRSFGDEAVDKLVGNQAVIGLQLGLLSGEGESIRVGDPVYAAVL